MNYKRIAAYICVITMLVSSFNPASAQSISDIEVDEFEGMNLAPYSLPGFLSLDKEEDSEEIEDENSKEEIEENVGPLRLTVDEAVSYGLENNKSMDLLDNAIGLALVSVDYADDKIEDLEDAKEKLSDAESDLFDLGVALDKNQDGLDQAYYYLSLGKSPKKITYNDIKNHVGADMLKMFAALGISGSDTVFSIGADIQGTIEDMFIALGYPEEAAEAEAKGYYDGVYSIIESMLDKNQDTIDEYTTAMSEARDTLDYNKDLFNSVLDGVADNIDTKINYNSVVKLDSDDAVKLMINMADVNLDVTRYAKGIYKNQIAMLIQKNYYDALYAEKMVKLKKVAMERGQEQYNMVKLSYENGMKAKDDLLLAKMYYDSTKISLRLEEATYKNAIYELKENMNIEMETEILLVDNMIEEVNDLSLEDGLKSGKTNRIEMQMVLGQWMIYVLNEDILSSKEYKYEKASIDESVLLREGAEYKLEQIKKTIESEICQSYENLDATEYMLDVSTDLIKDAEEVVSIAQLKYDQGFGAENSLLKQMNLETSSGTMIELIAAQENLANIESKVAQIRYNHTMAKVKYLNDAGILVY